MRDEPTTVWVTKYALSHGILRKECVILNQGRMARDKYSGTTYYHRGEFHLTFAAAVARAQEMRTKKIASLRKKIAKLESLDFSEDVK